MKRSAVIRLRDILGAIDAAAAMTKDRDLGAFRSDIQLRLAVERCIEIVSEASRHVPADAKERFPNVPWPEIAGIGNRLRHEYGRLDDIIVWRVATRFSRSFVPSSWRSWIRNVRVEGGDAASKRKLLDKQKEGKKRMRQFGRVEIRQEAFIAALKMEG